MSDENEGYILKRLEELDGKRVYSAKTCQMRTNHQVYTKWFEYLSQMIELRKMYESLYDPDTTFRSGTEQLEAELETVRDKIALIPSRGPSIRNLHRTFSR